MNKFIFLVTLSISTLLFTGCGSSDNTTVVVPPPEPDTLYLDDGAGGLAGVSYTCTSGSGFTNAQGAFTFYAGDNCTFDLTGFDGTVFLFDPLFVDYNDGTGVADISYDCVSGIAGSTDVDGSFDYDTDDACTFYL